MGSYKKETKDELTVEDLEISPSSSICTCTGVLPNVLVHVRLPCARKSYFDGHCTGRYVAADSVDDAKVYLLMSWVGHISLFPLLEERREVPTKILFTSIHMLLSYVSLDRYHRSEQRAIHIEQSRRGIRFNSLEHLYLCGLGVLLLFVEFIHPIFFVKYNADNEKIVMMPFLPLLMMSIYCASGLIYTWYLSYKQYVSKIKRIMSYAESPWLKPEQPETIPPSLVLLFVILTNRGAVSLRFEV